MQRQLLNRPELTPGGTTSLRPPTPTSRSELKVDRRERIAFKPIPTELLNTLPARYHRVLQPVKDATGLVIRHEVIGVHEGQITADEQLGRTKWRAFVQDWRGRRLSDNYLPFKEDLIAGGTAPVVADATGGAQPADSE